jgi:hypothetical protein
MCSTKSSKPVTKRRDCEMNLVFHEAGDEVYVPQQTITVRHNQGRRGPIPHSARFACQSTEMRAICAARFLEKSQKADVRIALYRPRQRWTALAQRDELKNIT